MANFKTFCRVISSIINLLFQKSVWPARLRPSKKSCFLSCTIRRRMNPTLPMFLMKAAALAAALNLKIWARRSTRKLQWHEVLSRGPLFRSTNMVPPQLNDEVCKLARTMH